LWNRGGENQRVIYAVTGDVAKTSAGKIPPLTEGRDLQGEVMCSRVAESGKKKKKGGTRLLLLGGKNTSRGNGCWDAIGKVELRKTDGLP